MTPRQFLIRLVASAALAPLMASVFSATAGCSSDAKSDGNRGDAQGDAPYVQPIPDGASTDSPGGESASNVPPGGDGPSIAPPGADGALDGSPSTDAASEAPTSDGGAGADASSCGECIRAIECVQQCGGPVLVASCCPCPPGMSDRLLSCGGAGDGGSDASPSDGGVAGDGRSGQDGSATSHSFACGPLTCTTDKQSCSIVNGHLPGQLATHDCVYAEGGPPSCGGPNSATSAGQCGCYASPNGEVTMTLCPP